jgi:hypothetical protein
MPRCAPLMGLALAALLTVTACSSSPDTEEASAPSEAPASSEAPAPSEAPAGSAPDTPETGTYSSEALATALEGITQADGSTLQMIPTAQVRQSMDQARQFLDAVTVAPEECTVFVSNSLDAPEGAGIATGVSSSNGDAIQTIVSAASSSETGFSEEQAAASEEALQACSSFTVQAQGLEIEQTVETVDAVTAADGTVGTTTVQSSSDGGKQQTITITGTRGDLAVTAVRTARNALPEGTQGELEDLIDAVLAATGQE